MEKLGKQLLKSGVQYKLCHHRNLLCKVVMRPESPEKYALRLIRESVLIILVKGMRRNQYTNLRKKLQVRYKRN